MSKEEIYQATDTKIAFRWSALESRKFNNEITVAVLYGQFSTQSDVWSFGVCVWELLEFGTLPYSQYSNKEITEVLKSGERLSKPSNCPDSLFQVTNL